MGCGLTAFYDRRTAQSLKFAHGTVPGRRPADHTDKTRLPRCQRAGLQVLSEHCVY